MSANRLPHEVHIPNRDDAPFARFVAEVFYLMVIGHLACRYRSRYGNWYFRGALYKTNGIPGMCNDDISGLDARDQLSVRNKRSIRTWRDNCRSPSLRENIVFGAKWYNCLDQPIEGPCAHT